MSTLDEVQKEIEELEQLQQQVNSLEESDFEDFLEFIKSSKWVSSHSYIRKLILCIYSCCKNQFKQVLYSKILVALRSYLEQLSESEIVFNIRNNVCRAFLFEEKIIGIDSLKKEARFNTFCFRFFSDEFEEAHPKFYQKILFSSDYIQDSIKYKDPIFHKKLRKIGLCEHEIAKFIYTDDIEGFQNYISQNNVDLDSQIPYSMYCTHLFTFSSSSCYETPQLIEFAAIHAAFKIFKYILCDYDFSKIPLPLCLPELACCGGNYEIIHLLEDRNMEFTKACVYNAITMKHYDLVDYLIDKYNFQILTPDFFNCAVSMLDFTYLKYFFAEGRDIVNNSDELHITPLIQACHEGRIDIVRYFLAIPNINVNISDSNKMTPLIYASIFGFIEIIELLYESKKDEININATDVFHKTALHYAAEYGYLDIVQFFYSLDNVDINENNDLDLTPFHLACYNGHLKIVKFMVESQRFDLNQKCGKYWQNLRIIARKSQRVTEYLDSITPLLSENENPDLSIEFV